MWNIGGNVWKGVHNKAVSSTSLFWLFWLYMAGTICSIVLDVYGTSSSTFRAKNNSRRKEWSVSKLWKGNYNSKSVTLGATLLKDAACFCGRWLCTYGLKVTLMHTRMVHLLTTQCILVVSGSGSGHGVAGPAIHTLLISLTLWGWHHMQHCSRCPQNQQLHSQNYDVRAIISGTHRTMNGETLLILLQKNYCA